MFYELREEVYYQMYKNLIFYIKCNQEVLNFNHLDIVLVLLILNLTYIKVSSYYDNIFQY
jgi:hypothetical protein